MNCPWVSLSNGIYHCVGIKSNGVAYSWGYSPHGQLGISPDSFTKIQTSLISKQSTIKDSEGTYPILKMPIELSDSDLLDKNKWQPLIPVPHPISSPTKFISVSCGAFHTVLVAEGGDLWGCGVTKNGRLGVTKEQVGEGKWFVDAVVKIGVSEAGERVGVKEAHCGNEFTLVLTE